MRGVLDLISLKQDMEFMMNKISTIEPVTVTKDINDKLIEVYQRIEAINDRLLEMGVNYG